MYSYVSENNFEPSNEIIVLTGYTLFSLLLLFFVLLLHLFLSPYASRFFSVLKLFVFSEKSEKYVGASFTFMLSSGDVEQMLVHTTRCVFLNAVLVL
jgi:hypothetical protein